MSFVFYDTETTGTDTFFDQILQFAAIRTDTDLNEIDRFEIRCRLLPHIVPAPGALRVTGVNVSHLIDTSLPSHYEMVRSIRSKLISWSPALFIGWNSLEFDEHLLRQAFYKTLHNPYLTSRVGNSRSDVMRIVQACSIFAPDALMFPTDDVGERVFKLNRVAPVNGFTTDRAHDALGDVEATIFLCRMLLERAAEVWSSFMRYSTKAAVVDYITEERLFCLSEFFFGKPYSFIVTTIGLNVENSAEWYVYDLSVDPDSLHTLSELQLAERLSRSPKPLRRLRSNKAPILCPADDAPDTCKGRHLGLEELERRTATLKEDTALCERLITAFESLTEEYPTSPHIEKQIYDGFFEERDERLMDAFHEAEWPERNAIVQQFQDSRLRAIGRQLIHLERPDLLDKAICREHDLARAKRLLGHGGDVPWLTLPKALQQLQEICSGALGAELESLQEHDRYLRKQYERALCNAKSSEEI